VNEGIPQQAGRQVPGMLVGNQFKPDVIDPVVLKSWVLAQGRTRREVTRTFYDAPMPGLNVPGFAQQNLRLRVASTTFREAAATALTTAYDHATHYSYDIHGNVKELIQDIPQLGTDGGSNGNPTYVNHRYKKLRYTYDLISGNVLRVDYGTGDDQMHHRYTYDADNRITEVETSADAVVWHQDAEYFYYPHGPLQRVELGEHKVQGVDYAYTLQGWLKGINSDRLTPETDMGHDGVPGNPNAHVGRDAYAESIGYFGDEDYKAIDASRWGGSPERPFAPVGTSGTLSAAYNPLYNGNIAHTVHSLQPWGGWTSPTQPAQVLAQVYRYDQLNRLKQAQGVEGLTAVANTWNGVTDAVANRYKSQYEYDANGNIESAKRWDNAGTQYDDLKYSYEKSGTQLRRNRLYHLNETIDGGYGDIGVDGSQFEQNHNLINSDNNYKYDELGNLIQDKREEIANIEWTVSGKVKRITRTADSTKPPLEFAYGADGQRISKTVGDPLHGGYKEYYLRDAQGNIMAMYRHHLIPVPNTDPQEYEASLKVTERPIYGSKRIGSYTQQIELAGVQAITNYPYTQPMQAPLKRYELTDHLGNVNTVVTGRLLPGNGAGSTYQAEVVSAQTLEAYGSLLPGRNWDSNKYAWGLNGQLKDDEVYGSTGTSTTAEFWQYDLRAARRWNLDPVDQVSISNYATFGLNPVRYNDPDGDCPWCFIGAAIDYGLQVADNYRKGDTGMDAWYGNVNFVSVATSAIPGGGVVGAIAKGFVTSAVEWTPNSGVSVEQDGSRLLMKTATYVAVDRVASGSASKLKVATSDEAVRAAERRVAGANQAVRKAENAAVKKPNSVKLAGEVDQAKATSQQARSSQVRTQMGNTALKQVPEKAIEKAVEVGGERAVGQNDTAKPARKETRVSF